MNSFYQFLNGMSTMGSLACSLFFYRFWCKTLDRLFFIFALSFLVMGLERMLLISHAPSSKYGEETAPIYLMRLCAFVMILFAIWDKNRRR